jgi:CubicO group peptidase (beta-lactamase class C family)
LSFKEVEYERRKSMNTKKAASDWPLPLVEPEEVGVSSKRLALIRPALQKYIDEKKVHHLVTLAARHGKIVYYEAQGYMDLEGKKPVKKDAIFRLWSNSKPLAGVATMICVEDGLLSLDDPVSRYIPAFKNPVVKVDDVQWLRKAGLTQSMVTTTMPANREITLRDCLRNTTGLVTTRTAPIQYMTEFKDIIQETGLLNPPDKQPDNMRKMVEALAKLPLDAQPGTKFIYQVGFPVIGLVIEMVTGKNLEEFYMERIFKRLQMQDTSFYLPGNKLDRFPTLCCPVQEGGKWKIAVMERPEMSERFTGPRTYYEAGGGRGGVLSTAADYARFAQMLLNGGKLDGERILSRKSVDLMTSSHTGDVEVTSPGPAGFGFGLGVGVYLGGGDTPELRSVGSYGWTGAAGTSYFADRKEDIICIIFAQVFMHRMIPGNFYQEEFEKLIYQALE